MVATAPLSTALAADLARMTGIPVLCNATTSSNGTKWLLSVPCTASTFPLVPFALFEYSLPSPFSIQMFVVFSESSRRAWLD